ncbi:MAG TPA: thioredoxin domain-containing protein [Blastocatellia bacterium]|jgi:protein-disulfide isomerase|nr:thioredoxin domain-containing protein [Blastocatellia bacterium]
MNRKDQIRMKRYLPFVIIAAALVAAVSVGFMMFRSSQPQTSANLTPAGGSGATPGAAISKGAVLIDEFGDYQCPPCGALHPILKTLKSEYGDRIQIAFHQFPLTQLHSHALEAAYAASAAGLQGKFWQMHDLLYETQSAWSQVGDFRPVLINYAHQLGLDVPRFTRDMDGLQVMTLVEEDTQRANAAGVNSTPTVFINGRLIPNENMTIEGLRKEINQRLPVSP